MKRLLLLVLLVFAIVPQARVSAQPGPTRFVPGLEPPALPFPSEVVATPGPADGTLPCTEGLADPQVDLPQAASPWREYQLPRVSLFATDQANSGTQSLRFEANRDGDPAAGPDVDAAGQEFALPAGLVELQGSLRYRVASGSAGPGDELRVELYEVGKVNASGLLVTAARIPLATAAVDSWLSADWQVTDPALIARLITLKRAVFLVRAVSVANPGTFRIWVDDLRAGLCAEGVTLSGRVRQGQTGAPGAVVSIVRVDAAGARVVGAPVTALDGFYSIGGLPILGPDERYQAWYLSTAQPPARPAGRIGLWAGPAYVEPGVGRVVSELNLDVADVALLAPPSYAEVVATDASPAALRWQRRGDGDERHQLCLYDPAEGDPSTGLPMQACGPILDPRQDELVFNLGPGSFTATPGLKLVYGRSYRWYVVVYQRDPRQDSATQFGFSFAERAITLIPQATRSPDPAPQPDLTSPVPGIRDAKWTLLIYVAADNALGDPRRAPASARPEGQFATLRALAEANPTVNLVSYVDGYSPRGATLCAYPPGAAPDCRQRAEPNSADPNTLAGFIALGRERYPATRTALLIIAPGQAAGELALDETAGTGTAALSLAGLQQAYGAAGLGPDERLDLVIYQVPLLGSVDAVMATAPYARYLVASSGQVWQLGAFARLVPLFSSPIQADPAAVATETVAAYSATVAASGGRRALAMAAYDLSRAGVLAQRVNTLARTLSDALTQSRDASRPALSLVRTAVQVYDSSGNGRLNSLGAKLGPINEDGLVDAVDLTGRLRTATGLPTAAQEAAGALQDLLKSPTESPILTATVRSGQSLTVEPVDLSNAYGLALFFPSGDRLGGQAALVDTYLFSAAARLPGDDPWSDLLRVYLAGIPGIGPGGVTAGGGGPQFRPLPGGFVRNETYLPLIRR